VAATAMLVRLNAFGPDDARFRRDRIFELRFGVSA
jgi:hypothetical protein